VAHVPLVGVRQRVVRGAEQGSAVGDARRCGAAADAAAAAAVVRGGAQGQAATHAAERGERRRDRRRRLERRQLARAAGALPAHHPVGRREHRGGRPRLSRPRAPRRPYLKHKQSA
jgi:hypothetical protein